MDETEFKQTYSEYNDRPCIFAKALLARCVGCSRAQKLNIAEREAMACRSPAAQARCAEVLPLLRSNALFTLRLTQVDGPLPHGKEMKVQCGGLHGLQETIDGGAEVTDVNGLLDSAYARYGDGAALPYSAIVKRVASFQLRKRGNRPAGG